MNHSRAGIGRLLHILVFGGWAAFLIWLTQNDRYLSFLIPGYFWLLVFGAVMSGTIAWVCFRDKHIHYHGDRRRDMLVHGSILMLPVLFAIAVQDQSLGADAVRKRRVDLDGKSDPIVIKNETILDLKPGENIAFKSLSHIAFRLNWDRNTNSTLWDKMDGKPVSAEGIFIDDKDNPQGYFRIYRFLITCCVADGQPIDAYVKCNDYSSLNDGAWVKVEGYFRLFTVSGRQKPYIDALSITQMPPPKAGQQYLY